MFPASSPAPLCLPRFGFVTTSDAVSRHLALSFSRFANRFPLGHPPALRPALMAARMHPADQTMRYLPHPY
jgi:hypothetical protein